MARDARHRPPAMDDAARHAWEGLGFSTQSIDGLVFGCLNNPGARKLGNTFVAPLIDRYRKCFLGSFFSHLKVAKMADERGDDAAPIGPVEGVDRDVWICEHAG